MGTSSGASIFTGIYSGLTNTYALIANQYGANGGVTLDNINAARTNTSLNTSLNQTFASYIQTNFSNLDKDGDGVISSSELSNLTNVITNQGLTQAQLAQLGTATGLSNDTLASVLEHFNDIDVNKDGKVTTSEISAYNITSKAEKKKMEYANRSASNMSVFYGDDTSSKADSSSMVDYKYLSEDS